VTATDDRIGGWQLMYQLLERDAWMIAENCPGLIECLPLLVRDDRRVEDVRRWMAMTRRMRRVMDWFPACDMPELGHPL